MSHLRGRYCPAKLHASIIDMLAVMEKGEAMKRISYMILHVLPFYLYHVFLPLILPRLGLGP